MNGWTERVGLLEQSWWKHNILVTPFKQFIVFIPFMLPDTANQFGWSRSSFWARQESFERKHQLLLHHCFGFLAYGDFATSWDNQLGSQTNCVPPFSWSFFSPHQDSFHLPDLTHFANFVNMNTQVGSQSKTCTERSQNNIYGIAESSPNDPLFKSKIILTRTSWTFDFTLSAYRNLVRLLQLKKI